MSDQIRISGKELGALSMPKFCPRCFWIKRKVPKGLPYQIFPGIFSSIDAYSKRVIHGWFDAHGSQPSWLNEVGEFTGYVDPPHHSKFFLVDVATNIKLTGAVDGIFVRADGSYEIVDYKTAKFTPAQDELYPIYETQLNAYARIAEETGIKPVTGLTLIYTEPVTDDEAARASSVHRDDGFAMDFSAGVHKVKLDTAMLDPHLARVRELYDMHSPPKGIDSCKDCSKLNDILSILP